jgi:putative Mn2+ efflux pump MntP
MGLISILIIAIALAMDAFAVSLSCGLCCTNTFKSALIASISFGVFQVGMTLIGWFFGLSFKKYISPYDHWFSFILLTVIGIHMLKESKKKDDSCISLTNIAIVVSLSIATSIDALATGISFSILNTNIIYPVCFIGIITSTMSFYGVIIGRILRSIKKIKGSVDIIGGSILIGMGIRILIEHLLNL